MQACRLNPKINFCGVEITQNACEGSSILWALISFCCRSEAMTASSRHAAAFHCISVPIYIVPFILLMLSYAIVVRSIRDVFSDASNSAKFEHLAVDMYNSQVYVGATNYLYQLSPNLRLEATVSTGPKDDNPNCPPPSSDCLCFGSSCKDFEKVPINSISKALVIDYRGERLISCISLFQVKVPRFNFHL